MKNSSRKQITVREQKELDAVNPYFTGRVCINFGTDEKRAILKEKESFNCEFAAVGSAFVAVHGYHGIDACDTSDVVAYDRSIVNAYDNAWVEAHDTSFVLAADRSSIQAYDNSRVEAHDSGVVSAHDNAFVKAYDLRVVLAFDNSRVEARGSSHIKARDNSQIEARGQSHINAHNNNQVETHGSQVKISGNAVVKKQTDKQATKKPSQRRLANAPSVPDTGSEAQYE